SSGTISPTSTTAFASGVWTGQVTLSQAGTGISISTTGSGKSGTSNTLIVNPAALDHFVFNAISSPQTAGKAFSITITAKDSNGNTVTSYTGTNTLTVSSGTLSPTSTGLFSSGVWTGSATLSVSGLGITIGTSGSSKSGTSNSFTVNSGALDHFVFSNIGAQTVGSAFSITITAKDSSGNTVTSYTGTNTLSVSLGTISPTSTGGFLSGVWTGSVTLSVSGSGITIGTSGSSKSGTSNAFTVNALVLDHFVFNVISSPQTAGSAFSITITAKDSNGNTVASYTGTNTLSVSAGTISPTLTGAFSNGVWTGSVKVTGAGSGVTLSTSGSGKSGTSGSFTVNPGVLDHFTFSTISSPQTAGAPFSITVNAEDASGNTVTSYSGTPTLSVSTGTISPTLTSAFSNGVWTGTVTMTGAGSGVTITATDGTHTGTSNSFTVNPTISASADAGGSITPTGSVSVNYGGSQSFNITANAGYQIADVVADNVSLGALSSYTFTDVQAAHTIIADFAINTFNISASAGAGGSISPNGSVSVNYGDNQTFTITANTGYYIVDVSVNGSSVGAVSSYTFTNVQASNTLSATFAPTPTPTPTPTATPTPTSSPSPTATPTPTATPKPTATPAPTPSPTPTPSATTVPATTDSGATVDLAIGGNVTSSQISNAAITSYQPSKTTTVSFTITGPIGTSGLGIMTIPKTAISYGTSPVVYIDDQQAPNQGYTQNANNFYVWYTTRFDTNLVNGVSEVTVQFLVPSTSPASSLGPLLAVGIAVPEIILIFTVVAVRRLRRNPDNI
ncbi:MAG: hypothetical protein ABSD92_05120, partial [Candidatus Bathyarchaeia archaeon]